MVLSVASRPAFAQLGASQLHSLFPNGGQAGTKVDVEVTSGEHLFEVDRIWFSHPGIRGSVKTVEVGGQSRPLFGEFTVTVDATVPPGLYDVRVAGLYGLSTPRTFAVGRLKESLEAEPNDSFDKATTAAIGSTIHGRIQSAADVDCFRFTAKAGERVLIHCLARRMESPLQASVTVLDAGRNILPLPTTSIRGDMLLDFTPPANGDYFLKIADLTYAGGTTLSYRIALDPGPHIDFILPPAGVPGSTARYTIYGRQLPGSKPSEFELGGVRLEAFDVEITLPNTADQLEPCENLSAFESGVDGVPYRLATSSGVTDPVMIYFAPQSLTREIEPNNTPQQAQAIAVPGEYYGQFQQPNDADLFTFTAQARETFLIEVFSQRYGTPVDAYLVIEQVTRQPDGAEQIKVLAEIDDNPRDNIYPGLFDTLTDDPVTRFVAPAEGTYRLTLRDRYGGARGAPSLLYRLSIRREQPDFRLVAFTHPINTLDTLRTLPLSVRHGETVPVAVLAFRRDGLVEPIDVQIEGLPPGLSCRGTTIDRNKSASFLYITCDSSPASDNAALREGQATLSGNWFGEIRIVGRARRSGQESLEHTARGAVTIANDTQEQRVTRGVMLSVIDELPPQQLSFPQTEFTVKRGSEIQVPAEFQLRAAKYTTFQIDSPTMLGDQGRQVTVTNVPFRGKKPDAVGSVKDTLKLKIDLPAGEHQLHLIGVMFLTYSSAARAEERVKGLEEDAKQELAASQTALRTAESSKDAASIGKARQRQLAAEEGQRYAQQRRKQHTAFAKMSSFGGRYYHASPALQVKVDAP